MANSIPRSLKIEIWERDGYRCKYCGKTVVDYNQPGGQLPNDAATVDHIRPKSKGGLDLPNNLVTSCFFCNHLLGDGHCNYGNKVRFISTYKKARDFPKLKRDDAQRRRKRMGSKSHGYFRRQMLEREKLEDDYDDSRRYR